MPPSSFGRMVESTKFRYASDSAHYAAFLLGRSNHNLLNFVERDFITRTIVKFRRARGFVCCDCLCLLNCAAIFQIGCNARCPERMATRSIGQPCLLARRLTISSTFRRSMRRSVSRPLFRSRPNGTRASSIPVRCRLLVDTRRDSPQRCGVPALHDACRLSHAAATTSVSRFASSPQRPC